MTRLTTLLITLVVMLGACGLAAPQALAQGDNAAVAVNTTDGSSLFKFAFSIRHVANGVVDQGNAAVAYASCESCQTVAVAIQIVLVATDPDVVTPTNLAIAINENCTLCETMAAAYQFVFGGADGRLGFSAEGLRRLAALRTDFRELGREELTLDEIAVRVDELMGELRDVLDTELVEVGPAVGQGAAPDDAGAGTATETTPAEEPPTATETTPTETAPEEPPPTTTETAPTEPTTTGDGTTTEDGTATSP